MENIRATIRRIRRLLAQALDLQADYSLLDAGTKRSLLEQRHAGVMKELSKKLAAYKEWASKLQPGGLQLTAIQLCKMPAAKAEAKLVNMEELTRMEDTIQEVELQLMPSWTPVRGSWLDVVLAVCCGWLAAVLRWCGFPAYTGQMRALLGFIAFAAWLLLASAIFSIILLPSGAQKAAAAGTAMLAVIAAASAAVQLWRKDDMPQRGRDIEQLEKRMKEARDMAAAAADDDDGDLASLARAMERWLEHTLNRAEEAKKAVRSTVQQPAAKPPAAQEPPAAEPPIDEAQAAEPPIDEAQAAEPPIDEAQAAEPPIDEPLDDEPPVAHHV